MAKRKGEPEMLGSTGHYDYDAACAYFPLGGFNGAETADALEDRNPQPQPTHVEKVEASYVRGNSHHNRTLVDGDPMRSVRAPSVEEGVSFSRPMRSDLDDDVFCW